MPLLYLGGVVGSRQLQVRLSPLPSGVVRSMAIPLFMEFVRWNSTLLHGGIACFIINICVYFILRGLVP